MTFSKNKKRSRKLNGVNNKRNSGLITKRKAKRGETQKEKMQTKLFGKKIRDLDQSLFGLLWSVFLLFFHSLRRALENCITTMTVHCSTCTRLFSFQIPPCLITRAPITPSSVLLNSEKQTSNTARSHQIPNHSSAVMVIQVSGLQNTEAICNMRQWG